MEEPNTPETEKPPTPKRVDLIEESQRGLLLSQIERCRLARIGRLSELTQIGGLRGNILGLVESESEKLQEVQFPEEVSILVDLLPKEAQKELEDLEEEKTGIQEIHTSLENHGKEYAKQIFREIIQVIYKNNLLATQEKSVELGKEE